MAIAPTTLDSGTTVLERYRVVRKLGSGGMGSVYLCDDLRLGVPVALKFIDAALLADKRFVDQILNETRLARRITHANVCRVHDVGEFDGVPFLSMEYVDGEDLKSLLRRIGRLPPDKALQIARQLCLGLFAAHEQGVLHRDLKPQNIMIDGNGNVRITDFGIAIERERSESGDTVVGTPAYLAPEVLGGGAPSVRSDLYSLGLVLHEVFTGRRVFEGTTMTELVDARSRAPRPPSDFVRDLDRDVERAILACLQPDPARRPESAMAVLAAFPGHDPLADALASGDTPSPALIAAASSVHKATPRSTIALIVVVALGYFAALALDTDLRLVDRFDAPLPPEVLAARARELATDLGAAMDRGAEAFGFEVVDPTVVRTPALTFFLRKAAPGRGIEPADLKARATYDDPPLESTGGFRLRLDSYGHLREFSRRVDDTSALAERVPADDVDLDRVWRASALDRGAFATTDPRVVPPVFAETRSALRGAVDGAPWCVDIATLRGRVVWFAARPEIAEHAVAVAKSGWRGGAQLVLVALALAVSIHTIRTRRGDVSGALRVGATSFCAVVLFTLLLGDTSGEWTGLARLAVRGMTHGIAVGMLLALQYFAIEAHVRRIWPHTVIGWSRLLAGRFVDPMVGREVLAGLAAGVATVCLVFAQAAAARAWSPSDFAPLLARPGAEEWLSGVSHGLGVLLELCVDMAREAFKLFFSVVLLRLVLRSPWIAAGAATVIWVIVWQPTTAGLTTSQHVLTVLMFALTVLLYVAVVVRFGLLSIVVAFVTFGALLSFPLRPDLQYWNAGVTALLPLAFAGLLAFAAHAAFRPASSPLRTSTTRA